MRSMIGPRRSPPIRNRIWRIWLNPRSKAHFAQMTAHDRFDTMTISFILFSLLCRLTNQLTGSGPSVTSQLSGGVAGPSFGGAVSWAGFLFLGCLAVNSKMLSLANHGAGPRMPATIIAHAPSAITMLRRVIVMAPMSCVTLPLHNFIRPPVTEVRHLAPHPLSPLRAVVWVGARGSR